MNKWEKFLQSKGHTKEQFAELEADKMAELTAEFQAEQTKEMQKAIEAKISKEEVDSIVAEALKGFSESVSKEEFSKLEQAMKTQGAEMAKLKDRKKSEQKTLPEELSEKKEAIKKVARGGSGEVEIKALTSRGSVANSPSGFVLPEVGQLGVKERSLYNTLPKINLSDGNHAGVVRYRDWDAATTVRAAAMVAEGAAFPESTAKWEWYMKPLRKVGDTLPVTEEFLEDEQQLSAELDMFLNVNVETEIDSQLVNGDNTGENLDGLLNTSPVFTPVNSGMQAPNLKDLVVKMRNEITRTRGSKYSPDILVVGSSTMENLVLAKDQNNNYIFDENTGTVGGLSVVIDENMPDNSIVVGDRRYARIYEKGGVALSRGLVNNQFNEDELTIKARKRLLLLVREVDKTGFRKVTDVDAAFTTLATNPV